MPIDRSATLRNAEKLLRQGKLDLAIAEYLLVVEDQPQDWNTANALGDLYVRAGQTDKAVHQFTRIADHLHDQGFLPKAAAVYKKVLKLTPDDEHALLRAGEIAGAQGLVADARSYFRLVSEQRRARGDDRGVADIVVRVGALDPKDYQARFDAARARVQQDDPQGAVAAYKELAADLLDKGRNGEAQQALREAAGISPDDEDLQARLIDLYVAAGDYDAARECASSSAQLKALAERLEAADQPDEALTTLQEAARRDPQNADPRVLLKTAESQLRAGHADEGLILVRRLLDDPNQQQAVTVLGWELAANRPDLAYEVVALAANAAAAQADFGTAAAALQEFVTRVPAHVPALVRLVEVSVDGELEGTTVSAQTQLADAYLAAGSAAEARAIAQDLVAREPGNRAHIERLRRALGLLGAPDPDALIAEHLSAQSSFMSGDDIPRAEPEGDIVDIGVAADSPADLAATEAASDLETLFDEMSTAAAPVQTHARAESGEVDLSTVLADIKNPVASAPPGDLDGVFAQMRQESSQRSGAVAAEDEYQRAMALYDAGRVEEALPGLQTAARAPKFRFQAASLAGRVYRDRGMLSQAIEWLERAAQAPPTSAAEGHLLLFELADALETAGETARALAICMELRADAGNFRDVAARIDRLARVQARG